MRDLSDESIRKDCPHCHLGSFALEHPLSETENFRIICDVHPLTEGHILIMPKDHISCAGVYPRKLFAEFENVYQNVTKFISKTYGSVASFEHGVFGQTVYHSHIHLLPFSRKITDIIPEGKEYLKQISNLSVLEREFKNQGGYLFFSHNGKNYLVDKTLAQPRFFRDRFARALGNSERADWKAVRQNPHLLEEMKTDILNLVKKWRKYQIHTVEV